MLDEGGAEGVKSQSSNHYLRRRLPNFMTTEAKKLIWRVS